LIGLVFAKPAFSPSYRWLGPKLDRPHHPTASVA
jgi:hypothetical protein